MPKCSYPNGFGGPLFRLTLFARIGIGTSPHGSRAAGYASCLACDDDDLSLFPAHCGKDQQEMH